MFGFLYVTPPDIKGRSLCRSGDDQGGIGTTGEAKRSGNSINRVLGFHLSGVMQDQRSKTALIGQSVQCGQTFVVFDITVPGTNRTDTRQGIEDAESGISDGIRPLGNIINPTFVETFPSGCE